MPNFVVQLFSFIFPLLIVGILVLGVYLRGRGKNRAIKENVLTNLKKSLSPYITSTLEESQLSANQWMLEPQPKPSTNLKQLEITIQLTQRQVFFALLSNKLMGSQDFIVFEGNLEKSIRGTVIEIIPTRENKIIEKNYKYLIEFEDVNLGVSKKLDNAYMQKTNNVKVARKILGVRDLLARFLKAEDYMLWLTVNKEAPHLKAIYRINDSLDIDNATKLFMDLASRIKP